MDQIHDSKYPSSSSSYSLSRTLFIVGIILFLASPVNYAILRNPEHAMIIIAYSFFFFLGSALVGICGAELRSTD
jgi:hypothetical protein